MTVDLLPGVVARGNTVTRMGPCTGRIYPLPAHTGDSIDYP